MAKYSGDWADLDAALSAPNVVNVHDTEDGVTVIFKVHGREGFRAYHYTAPSYQALYDALATIAGVATVSAESVISGMTGGTANGSNPRSQQNQNPFDQ